MNIQNTKPRLPSSISLAILLERTRTSHLPIRHLDEQKKTAGLIAVSISEPKTMLLSPSVCCYMQTAPSSPSHVESTPTAVPKDKPGRTLLLLKCSAKILHCLCCVNEHLRKTEPNRLRAGFCFWVAECRTWLGHYRISAFVSIQIGADRTRSRRAV